MERNGRRHFAILGEAGKMGSEREMIDTHIHLDADQYYAPDQVIERARAAGLDGIVVPGTGPESSVDFGEP